MSCASLFASTGTIDTVYSFTPGSGQNIGQSEEYFPENIFGLPSRNASKDLGESNPNQILSLGLNGEIIVGFKDMQLLDGPGPDFIVFENAFRNPFNNLIYAEPAIVSVSDDGINFVEFPYDSATLQGLAGVQPTNGKADPFDPEVSGGDKFDIADLGFEYITHIKIKDATEIIKNNPSHKYWDVTLTGFDLDAVVGLYLDDGTASVAAESNFLQRIANSFESEEIGDAAIYTYDGRAVKSFSQSRVFNLSGLKSGLYFFVFFNDERYVVKKYFAE